ncbi:MAG: arginine repressor [Lachnospiraceae bacterium]|nr:arginine repressor [Lachnospiraceae bacterium]
MKKDRQKAIALLIQNNEIETQDELVEKLQEAGFDATQSTVSRDIRQMNLKKAPGESGRSHYVAASETASLTGAYGNLLKEGLVSADIAMNLLVLKTKPGMAMAAAAAVDALELRGIVGTIAGDDTIMVAVRSKEEAKIIQKKFSDILSS